MRDGGESGWQGLGDPLAASDPKEAGPYRLTRRLGAGAMGRVYVGVPAAGDDPTWVAVKILRPDLAQDAKFRRRFARELAAARLVRHPRTANVVGGDPDAEQPWLATELIDGPSLQRAVEEDGPLDPVRGRALARGIAEALVAIHAVGIVHRDLKPSNVLLGPDGPKVIDFGVARAIDATVLTSTGQAPGTPAYMAPEQAELGVSNTAGDVFALGAVLAFALSGRPPFGTGMPLAILHRVVNRPPDLLGVADGDPELRELVEACLDKDPARRPAPRRVVEVCGGARDPGTTHVGLGVVGVTSRSLAEGPGSRRSVGRRVVQLITTARTPWRERRRLILATTLAAVVAAVATALVVSRDPGGTASAAGPGAEATRLPPGAIPVGAAPSQGTTVPPGSPSSAPRKTAALGPTSPILASVSGGSSSSGPAFAPLSSAGEPYPTYPSAVTLGPPATTSATGPSQPSSSSSGPTHFNGLIGDGCSGSVDGGNYWPLDITGTGWGTASGSWTGDGCTGSFRWHPVDPTGAGQDTFTWQFDTGLTSASCIVRAYIPANTTYVDDTGVVYSVNAGGTNAPGQPTTGGTVLGNRQFDQMSHQRSWLTLGTFSYTGVANGRINVIMADARTGAAKYVVAGPVRLICN